MHRSLAVVSVLLVVLPQSLAFLWGGGCCGAPVVQSCCQSTSWAYAPPRVIGYERIPLYAKVPMPAPSYVRMRPPPMVQSSPYYPPPPPPPSPSSYISQSTSYYPPSPMDNTAPAPSSVGAPLSSVIPPPQDKYDDGDVIVIETDDSRRRRMSSHHFVQPPPTGYVSQPVAPQGYAGVQQPQQPIVGGQIEQGIEVTPEQISSGYQPQQLSNPSAYGSQASPSEVVQSVASNAAYEATGIAPSARRLRKFKN